MGETWPYLLTAIVIVGLALILGLAWLAFLEGVLKPRARIDQGERHAPRRTDHR